MTDIPSFATPDAALEFLAQTWISMISSEIDSLGEREYDKNLATVPDLRVPDLETAKIDVQVPGNVSAMLHHLKGTYDRAYQGQTDVFPRAQRAFSSSLNMRSTARRSIDACFDDFSDFLEDRMDEIRAQAMHVMMAADMTGIGYAAIFTRRDLGTPSQEL